MAPRPVRAMPITRARATARRARRYGYYANPDGSVRVICPDCRQPVHAELRAARSVTAALDEAVVAHLVDGWCPSHPHPLDQPQEPV